MLRFEASFVGEDTIRVRDTVTGAVGFYSARTGAFRLGTLTVDITTDAVLDQLYWSIPIAGGDEQ